MWTVPTGSIRIISPPCARKMRCTRGKSQHAEWTCRRARPAGPGTVAAPAVRQHTVENWPREISCPQLTPESSQRARELKSYRRQPPVFWKGSGTVATRTDVIWRNCVHFRAPRERLNGTSPSAETGVWGKFGRITFRNSLALGDAALAPPPVRSWHAARAVCPLCNHCLCFAPTFLLGGVWTTASHPPGLRPGLPPLIARTDARSHGAHVPWCQRAWRRCVSTIASTRRPVTRMRRCLRHGFL